ncbi:MAG TPA: hypothetical protein VJW76_13570 [Verrucomicrobiae bacterium]|nr:hypothetical protein [Verrucomicrobiae bacterium]
MTTARFHYHHRGLILGAVGLIVLGAIRAAAQPAPDLVWSVITHSYFVSPVTISRDGVLVASGDFREPIGNRVHR